MAVARAGEALCGETGFCCGFWTPNWWEKAFGVHDTIKLTDQWSAALFSEV